MTTDTIVWYCCNAVRLIHNTNKTVTLYQEVLVTCQSNAVVARCGEVKFKSIDISTRKTANFMDKETNTDFNSHNVFRMLSR